jgi:hypothetical protein
MGYSDYLRTSAATQEPLKVLRSSPEVLLGVGPAAAAALSRLGIESVYDLARSATFAAAGQVQRAAHDPASVEARTGELPSDVFSEKISVPLSETPSLRVQTLRLVANSDPDGVLAESLDVQTVRDLALWPPYLAAQALLNEATDERPLGPNEVPNDLLPMSGR